MAMFQQGLRRLNALGFQRGALASMRCVGCAAPTSAVNINVHCKDFQSRQPLRGVQSELPCPQDGDYLLLQLAVLQGTVCASRARQSEDLHGP